MGYLIAVTGKGGVGKTTVSSLIVSRLAAHRRGPVLAVDADPNSCLDVALGVTVKKTVGGVREEAREIASKGMATGVAKQQLLEMKIAESLVEMKDFDLLAMGRPEGPGCYCYANNVLKETIARIASQYPYIVVDNEAGLENISRRIVTKIDLLLIVTDPSHNGLETVRRLHGLAKEMGVSYRKLAIIVNRLRSDALPETTSKLKENIQADAVVGLPDCAEIADFAEKGRRLAGLTVDNAVQSRMDSFLRDMRLF